MNNLMYSCLFSLRSTVVPSLLVIFTIRENFRKFPPNVKFPENLQPQMYLLLQTDVLWAEMPSTDRRDSTVCNGRGNPGPLHTGCREFWANFPCRLWTWSVSCSRAPATVAGNRSQITNQHHHRLNRVTMTSKVNGKMEILTPCGCETLNKTQTKTGIKDNVIVPYNQGTSVRTYF